MRTSIVNFIRATLTGGIIFLLPIVLIILVIAKAIELLLVISGPLAARMADGNFLGLDGSMLLAILLLIILCFLSGLFYRSAIVKKWIALLEENVLIYLPGYSLMKSITIDTLGEQDAHKLLPVMVRDGENWNMGFLVEEKENLCTVFIPDAPRYDAGEVRIVPSGSIKKLNINTRKFTQSIKNFGAGTLDWVGEN